MAQVTDLAVRKLATQATRYIAWFGEGLGVRVSPTGQRTFVYWYRSGKQKRLLTLGTYPTTSVAEARARHREAQNLREAEVDPVQAKRQRAAERAQAEAAAQAQAALAAGRPTLRQTFARWKETDLVPRTDPDGTRHGRKDGGKSIEQVFNKWVFPKHGDKPAADVGKGDLMEVFDAANAKGQRRTAALLFSNLRQMFDFAFDRDIVPANPLTAVKRRKVAGKATKRKRVLADWEATRLLERLPAVDLEPITVLALRFVLITGQRPGEVAGMAKAEVSQDGTLWTIPAARYKTGVPQLVPLSTAARGLLEQAAALNRGSAYVFPSPQARARKREPGKAPPKDAPIDRHSLSRAVLRKLGTATAADQEPAAGELGLAPFTPHDLRRTCRTGLAALGVLDHIAERVIGHVIEGEMQQVYNQHDYLPERRAALEAWGAKVQSLRPAR
jgi:integrase